jgi:hypothetical protein
MTGEIPMTSFTLASMDVNVNNITSTWEQKNQCHNVSAVVLSPRAKQQPQPQAKQQPQPHEVQLMLNREFIIVDNVGFNRPQLRVFPSMKTNTRYVATKPSPPKFGGWRINETKDFIIVDAVGINTVASA